MSGAPQKSHVYKTTLRDTYGLTPSMIERLGEPDLKVPNPHYRSGPEASLYCIERVEMWLEAHHEEILQARAQREARSSRGRQVAARRGEQLLQWAREVAIRVTTLGPDIRQEATTHYALSGRGEPGPVGWNGLVAFARHNRTNYHRLLQELEGKPASEQAYMIIHRRVNEAVELALAECLEPRYDHEALVSEREAQDWLTL